MKATKYLSLAALALMGTLASCQSDDEAAVSFARPANAVGINVTVGAMQTTRTNPASADPDEAHLFNLGDQVSVSTDGQDPVLFQCTNADQQTWAEAEAGKFLLWKQNEMTFQAFYPATEGTSMTAFTLPADQSTEAKIALADYMIRQQTCTNVSGNDINLELERKTARVIVRIAGFNDQYNNDDKTVDNVRIYSESSGIEDGNPTGSSAEIQPYAQGSYDGWGWRQNSTFTALVVPGYGDSGARFITLSDGESNTLEVKGIPELREGYSYTYDLTVGKNKILVQSVTVEEWAAGTTLAGGQAQEQPASIPLDLTSPAVGQVIGSDGKNYAAGSVPTGVTKVAMIAYLSGSNGMALALADEDAEGGSLNWATAKSTCEAKTPAFTGGTWKLPSQEEWNQMFIANGGSEGYYTGLNTALAAAGGNSSKLQEDDDVYYWSSTPDEEDFARCVNLDGVAAWGGEDMASNLLVRACLAFTLEKFVDLGTSVLWAKCNVGANSPEEYGGYFSWAETETKTDYSYDSYTYGTKYNITKYNATDGKTTLEPTDDAAAVNWGNGWRMPTEAEWKELLNNTTHTWTTQGEVEGLLLTATNGNTLFLPAAGYRWGTEGNYSEVGKQCRYWTSSLKELEYPQYVRGFVCKTPFPAGSTADPYVTGLDRNVGEPVRAVRAK